MDDAKGSPTRAQPLAPWLAASLVAGMFVGTALVTPLYDLYREQFGFGEITLTLVYAVYVIGNLFALAFFLFASFGNDQGIPKSSCSRFETTLPACLKCSAIQSGSH